MEAFNVSAWIDNFKYQFLTLKNQKVADKNRNFFLQCWFIISNCNSKSISACYNKLDA